MEQPKEEEENRDNKYDQASPEHDTLLSYLKRQPLLLLASLVSSRKVKPSDIPLGRSSMDDLGVEC